MPVSADENAESNPSRPAAAPPFHEGIRCTHRPNLLLPPEELSGAALKEWLVSRAGRHGMLGSGD